MRSLSLPAATLAARVRDLPRRGDGSRAKQTREIDVNHHGMTEGSLDTPHVAGEVRGAGNRARGSTAGDGGCLPLAAGYGFGTGLRTHFMLSPCVPSFNFSPFSFAELKFFVPIISAVVNPPATRS
jgi:hypothetical protein